MKNPKLHIAVAMLAAFLACAGAPAAARDLPCMTVSAAEQTEIAESTTLDADKTIDGDLILNANLNLNGHTLTVKGSLIQPAGALIVAGGGTLKITGNYVLGNEGSAGKGELQLFDASILDIGGDFIVDTTIGRSYYQKSATIRIGGDLKVFAPDGGKGLEPSNDVLFTFTGQKQHSINFGSASHSFLSQVSAETGSTLLLEGETSGFTLASDLTLADGSTVSGSNNLNLNGHTMTVNGDFIQSGKLAVNVDKSTLNVNGAYWHQHGYLIITNGSVNVKGSYEQHIADGTAGDSELQLFGESTVFEIGSNMIVDTTLPRSYYQKAGLIKIGGDLEVYNPDGGKGLEPTSTVQIQFTGKKQHKVNFASAVHSYLTTVSAEKGSSLYLTGETSGFTLASDLVLVGGSRITGGNSLTLNGHTLQAAGDFIQAGSLTINTEKSTLLIGGDYWHQSGCLNISDGTVKVLGNYEMHTAAGSAGTGEMQINGESAVFEIGGNMIVDTTLGRSYYQKAGLIKIGGDLEVYNPDNGKGLEPAGAVNIHFTGKAEHKVHFANASYSFLSNVSADEESVLKLTGETSGFTLASDLTLADGSTVSGSNNLNLNGHTMTVNGDFIQSGKLAVNVDKSTLNVNGAYWHQHGYLIITDGSVNVKGSYEQHIADGTAGDSELQLFGEGTVFEIGGNMIVDSTISRSYYQKAGAIKIGGSLKCYAPDNGIGLEPASDISFIFTGNGLHEVYFDKVEFSYLSNVGTEGGGKLFLTGNTRGFNLISDVEFADGSVLNGSSTLSVNDHTVTVSGSFYQNGATIKLGSGKFLVAKDYWFQHGCLMIEAGTLNIANNFEMHEKAGTAGSGELQLTDENGKLIVGGDAIFDSTIGRSYYQGKGLVSITGNLKVYEPEKGHKSMEFGSGLVTEFCGGGTHEVYFAGTSNFLGSLRVGIGDTVKFTGAYYDVESFANAVLTAEAADLVEISGASLTGKTAGKGTLTLDFGSPKYTKTLYVGGSGADAPYAGKIILPKSELAGDVNADGAFNIADAVLLARWLAGDSDAALLTWKNGDFTADGKLTAADLTAMKQKLLVDYVPTTKPEETPTETPTETPAAEPTTIASNFNIAGVSNHPTKESTFTVPQECKVYSILTYHWNSGKGQSLGTIGLLEDGKEIGVWTTKGTKGQSGADNCNWWAYPQDLVLKPGHTYTVVDSDPDTWSHNSISGNAGFFEIQGNYIG